MSTNNQTRRALGDALVREHGLSKVIKMAERVVASDECLHLETTLVPLLLCATRAAVQRGTMTVLSRVRFLRDESYKQARETQCIIARMLASLVDVEEECPALLAPILDEIYQVICFACTSDPDLCISLAQLLCDTARSHAPHNYRSECLDTMVGIMPLRFDRPLMCDALITAGALEALAATNRFLWQTSHIVGRASAAALKMHRPALQAFCKRIFAQDNWYLLSTAFVQQMGGAMLEYNNSASLRGIKSQSRHHYSEHGEAARVAHKRVFRYLVTTTCIALQSLGLPALMTLGIVDEQYENDYTMFFKWNVIAKVKHFKQRD